MNDIQLNHKFRNQLIAFLFPLLITCAIYNQLFSPSCENGKSVIWFFIYACLYFSIRYINKKCKAIIGQREKNYSAVLAALFAFLSVLGHVIKYNLESNLGTKNYVLDAVSFIGLFLAFYYTLLLVFCWIKDHSTVDIYPDRLNFLNGKKSFKISWIIIFCSWLVYLIICYPGLLSNDSFYQVGQGVHGITSNWHPVIHTWLITLFIRVGLLFNDINFGIFLYSLTQIAILSAICAYSIYFMQSRKIKTTYCFIVLLYYAFFPVNALLGITMWKDILFSGITLLLVLFLFDIADNSEQFFSSRKNIALLILISFLFCVFRSNGLFAFLVFTPFFFVLQRRYWKKVLLICCSCFLLVAIYKGPIFHALNITDSPASEAFSVPVQQIARTVKKHHQTLTKNEIQQINEILPYDKLANLYNPQLSDPVKFKFNNNNYSKNKLRYVALWFDLLKKHPKTYIEAFLASNYGDWDPDVSYTINIYQTGPNDLGIIQASHPIAANFIKKAVGDFMPSLPAVSMMFSIGFVVWILIFLFTVCIYKNQKYRILSFALLFALWLTILAAPDVEYRYAYGLILSCPTCIGMCLLRTDKLVKNKHYKAKRDKNDG